MASLSKSRMLFAFTSPRTLEKIIPEIGLLSNLFEGQKWDKAHQIAFYNALKESTFFEGTAEPQSLNDGIQARDRINRAPRALGFIHTTPVIKLTPAGENLLSGFRIEETITRQLLKFQLPSPNHTQSTHCTFCVKPYLELLRLIYDLGSLSKFEIAAFFTQMIDYHDYDAIKQDILDFRAECAEKRGSVNIKVLKDAKFRQIISRIWRANLESGETSTRESADSSPVKFINTKMQNCKDYADAFVRYLRASGLVSLQKGSYHAVISQSKKEEVEHILSTVPREPIVFANKLDFYDYLGASDNIRLLSDDANLIKKKLAALGEVTEAENLHELKVRLDNAYKKVKEQNEESVIVQLQDYSDYDDILHTFDRIKRRDIIDAPLMLEYNAWRAMTMLDHAIEVKGNFVTDADCMPISTAGGGKADIEIRYKDFGLIVEVTTAGGSKQYEMEGEPVARHFGQAKATINPNMYCIFIAPTLNENSIAHMFNTNRFNTKAYGGKTKIIPMSIDVFVSFVAATKDTHITSSKQIQDFLEGLWQYGQSPEIDEIQWQTEIQRRAACWVN